MGSGRTDTGVHAKQQYFHADVNNHIDPKDFSYHLNAVLPKDIFVRSIRKVKSDAHARFDALSRSYDYVIMSYKDPFQIDEAYIYTHPVELTKLNNASKLLIGKHNFESFSKVKTQVNNFMCEVFEAYWHKQDESFIFHIKANRFLRGMVRAIVGTLLMVNEDKIKEETIIDILKSQDRTKAGRSVSPSGLYLAEIKYPDHIFEN